jgi:hypothetical protein
MLVDYLSALTIVFGLPLCVICCIDYRGLEQRKEDNVPHEFVHHTGSCITFAKPLPKPPYSSAKQPTLALYRAIQYEILFRVYFYCLLTRTRVMPSLIALSAAPLS